MKNKIKIGQDVLIKVCNIPAIVTDIKYEVAYSDKDNNPCKGTFSCTELAQLTTSETFGFHKNEN